MKKNKIFCLVLASSISLQTHTFLFESFKLKNINKNIAVSSLLAALSTILISYKILCKKKKSIPKFPKFKKDMLGFEENRATEGNDFSVLYKIRLSTIYKNKIYQIHVCRYDYHHRPERRSGMTTKRYTVKRWHSFDLENYLIEETIDEETKDIILEELKKQYFGRHLSRN
ncbi:hypothetical protein ACFLYA_02600 [Candidatus Dependentiae bacterium]